MHALCIALLLSSLGSTARSGRRTICGLNRRIVPRRQYIARKSQAGGWRARLVLPGTGTGRALYCAYLRQRDVPGYRRTCRERKDEARLMGEYGLGWVQLDGEEIGEGQW